MCCYDKILVNVAAYIIITTHYYTIFCHLIIHGFSEHDLQTPWRWCINTETCRSNLIKIYSTFLCVCWYIRNNFNEYRWKWFERFNVAKGMNFVSRLHFRPCHGSKVSCPPLTAEVQFSPKPFHVGFKVNQVPQKQGFLRRLRFFRQLSFHQFSKLV